MVSTISSTSHNQTDSPSTTILFIIITVLSTPRYQQMPVDAADQIQ